MRTHHNKSTSNLLLNSYSKLHTNASQYSNNIINPSNFTSKSKNLSNLLEEFQKIISTNKPDTKSNSKNNLNPKHYKSTKKILYNPLSSLNDLNKTYNNINSNNSHNNNIMKINPLRINSQVDINKSHSKSLSKLNQNKSNQNINQSHYNSANFNNNTQSSQNLLKNKENRNNKETQLEEILKKLQEKQKNLYKNSSKHKKNSSNNISMNSHSKSKKNTHIYNNSSSTGLNFNPSKVFSRKASIKDTTSDYKNKLALSSILKDNNAYHRNSKTPSEILSLLGININSTNYSNNVTSHGGTLTQTNSYNNILTNRMNTDNNQYNNEYYNQGSYLNTVNNSINKNIGSPSTNILSSFNNSRINSSNFNNTNQANSNYYNTISHSKNNSQQMILNNSNILGKQIQPNRKIQAICDNKNKNKTKKLNTQEDNLTKEKYMNLPEILKLIQEKNKEKREFTSNLNDINSSQKDKNKKNYYSSKNEVELKVNLKKNEYLIKFSNSNIQYNSDKEEKDNNINNNNNNSNSNNNNNQSDNNDMTKINNKNSKRINSILKEKSSKEYKENNTISNKLLSETKENINNMNSKLHPKNYSSQTTSRDMTNRISLTDKEIINKLKANSSKRKKTQVFSKNNLVSQLKRIEELMSKDKNITNDQIKKLLEKEKNKNKENLYKQQSNNLIETEEENLCSDEEQNNIKNNSNNNSNNIPINNINKKISKKSIISPVKFTKLYNEKEKETENVDNQKDFTKKYSYFNNSNIINFISKKKKDEDSLSSDSSLQKVSQLYNEDSSINDTNAKINNILGNDFTKKITEEKEIDLSASVSSKKLTNEKAMHLNKEDALNNRSKRNNNDYFYDDINTNKFNIDLKEGNKKKLVVFNTAHRNSDSNSVAVNYNEKITKDLENISQTNTNNLSQLSIYNTNELNINQTAINKSLYYKDPEMKKSDLMNRNRHSVFEPNSVSKSNFGQIKSNIKKQTTTDGYQKKVKKLNFLGTSVASNEKNIDDKITSQNNLSNNLTVQKFDSSSRSLGLGEKKIGSVSFRGSILTNHTKNSKNSGDLDKFKISKAKSKKSIKEIIKNNNKSANNTNNLSDKGAKNKSPYEKIDSKRILMPGFQHIIKDMNFARNDSDEEDSFNEKSRDINTDEEEENLKKYIKDKIVDIKFYNTDKIEFNEDVGYDMLLFTRTILDSIVENTGDYTGVHDILKEQEINMHNNPVKRFKDYFKFIKKKFITSQDKERRESIKEYNYQCFVNKNQIEKIELRKALSDDGVSSASSSDSDFYDNKSYKDKNNDVKNRKRNRKATRHKQNFKLKLSENKINKTESVDKIQNNKFSKESLLISSFNHFREITDVHIKQHTQKKKKKLFQILRFGMAKIYENVLEQETMESKPINFKLKTKIAIPLSIKNHLLSSYLDIYAKLKTRFFYNQQLLLEEDVYNNRRHSVNFSMGLGAPTLFKHFGVNYSTKNLILQKTNNPKNRVSVIPKFIFENADSKKSFINDLRSQNYINSIILRDFQNTEEFMESRKNSNEKIYFDKIDKKLLNSNNKANCNTEIRKQNVRGSKDLFNIKEIGEYNNFVKELAIKNRTKSFLHSTTNPGRINLLSNPTVLFKNKQSFDKINIKPDSRLTIEFKKENALKRYYEKAKKPRTFIEQENGVDADQEEDLEDIQFENNPNKFKSKVYNSRSTKFNFMRQASKKIFNSNSDISILENKHFKFYNKKISLSKIKKEVKKRKTIKAK